MFHVLLILRLVCACARACVCARWEGAATYNKQKLLALWTG